MLSGFKNLLRPPMLRALRAVPGGLRLQIGHDALPDRMRHLNQLGFSPSVIVDIGAFEGMWARAIAEQFPAAQIFMIEAQDSKSEILRKRCAELGSKANYTINLLGSAPKENVTFYELGTGSSIYSELTDHQKTPTIKTMTTLSEVLQCHNVINPDFIKLDVQGAEIDILLGGLDVLKTSTMVQAELSVTPYNDGAPLASEVIAFMWSKNFVLYDLFEAKRVNNSGQISQIDALFLNRNSTFWSTSRFEASHRNHLGTKN
ncbi:hypothetical protein CSW58_08805 [Caulobacter sp. B11]|uniref:FkbM family methyltransferase n=1 Tax=Caulobacter sp. B11 TaxID=2048899 RepID=UPI000C12D98A|nr:FkbM family methyltransferase [Caulobacter sp. B11]PHY12989.1 hypothetical protein CSW58_08805 [Caulobacter sp. B11]